MDEIISLISRSIIPIIIILSILSRGKNSDNRREKAEQRRKNYIPNDYKDNNDTIQDNDIKRTTKTFSTNEDYYTDYIVNNEPDNEPNRTKEVLKDYTKDDKSMIRKTEIKDSIDIEIDFDKEDIIKGIIMSEVLSKPKCLQRR
jgi:hypothetical protein